MKLSNSQKNQIYNETMIVDDYEWVPCINHVLEVLGYEDSLEHDENYEVVKWSGTNPFIKDEKVRKAVRAWADACGLSYVSYKQSSNEFYDPGTRGAFAIKFKITPVEVYLEDGECYTIAELCGDEND